MTFLGRKAVWLRWKNPDYEENKRRCKTMCFIYDYIYYKVLNNI